MLSAERTVEIGDRATELMRAHSLSATPRSYALWYLFATGLEPRLNEAVKALVGDGKALSEDRIDRLYEQHLLQADEADRDLLPELRKVAGLIEAALGRAARSGAPLPDAGDRKLRETMEGLVGAARAVAAGNRDLESRLRSSRGEIENLRRLLDEARTESLTDTLTGIANRKHFDLVLTAQAARCRIERTPLVLIMIDIDHFKRFNDDFGHLTGDQVLRLVAAALGEAALGENAGSDATLARFGGEEFALILPGADESAALARAEAIRRNVMNRELLRRSSGESLGRVTVSLGIAQWRMEDSVRSLLQRADLCLYRAKQAGRNRTVSDWDPQAPGLSSAA